MGSDRIEVYRITDFLIPLKILSNPEIVNAIHEDGLILSVPNVVDEYWIGIKNSHGTIGCFRVHPMTSVMWQIHARILPEYRREYSIKSAHAALRWCTGNIASIETVICVVPKSHRDVALFVRRVGFTHCGIIPKSYKKNNRIYDIDIFSYDREKIEKLEV